MKKNKLILIMFLNIIACGCSQIVEDTQQESIVYEIDEDQLERGKFINEKDGLECADERYRMLSDYFEIEKDKVYVVTLENEGGGTEYFYKGIIGAYYDDNHDYIDGLYVTRSNQDGGEIDCGGYRLYPPYGCKYIRFAVDDVGAELKWIINCYDRKDNQHHYFQEDQKTIAWFGDSIVGNTLDESSVTEQLSILQGALVYNCGFGGCRMSTHAEGWDYCSMYNIAENVYSGDFHELKLNVDQGWQGMPGYFKITSRLLSEEIEYSQLDYIIISYGTNDYTGGQAALEGLDIYDPSTVCGALRKSILMFQERCPGAKIIVTSPTYRYFIDKETNEIIYDSNTKDFGNGTLPEFSKAYGEVCEGMNVYFLDLYNCSEISETTRGKYFDSGDGTHPNALGRKEIAKEVSDFIDSIEKVDNGY